MRTSAAVAPSLVDAPDRGWIFRRICFFGILVLQMFAVLAFGAVEYWSIGIIHLVALLLFAVWVGSVLVGGTLRLRRNPLFLPMLGFIGLVGVQYLTRRSVYIPATRDALLLLISDFLLFFVLVNTVDTPGQKRPLAFALVAFGVAVASFALAQDFSETKKLFWWREPSYGGWIYGPYVNHNHYAGFINMLALFPVALVLGRMVRRDKSFLMFSLTAIMFASLVFSASRGGMVSFAAEIVVLGVVFLKRRQARQLLVVGAVAVLLATLAGGVGMVVLRTRFGMRPERLIEGRVMVWKESMQGIREHFWSGTGLGTFWLAYPQYRSTPSNLRWNEAHNDYVQVFFETGLAGFLLLVWFLWRLGAWVLPRLMNDQDPEFGLILGATLGIVGVLAHSFTDFNLQIPANGMLFLLLCGLATA